MNLRRVWLVAGLLLVLMPSFMVQSADYTAKSLFFTVYFDGVVDVDYTIDLDPTLARVSVILFGNVFDSLIVTNQEGIPLDYSIKSSIITVDTLGATRALLSYSTQDLTTKISSLWNFNVTSPTTIGVLLPTGSTILGMNQIPLEMSTIDGKPYVSFPLGINSLSYTLGTLSSKDHALALIKDAESAIGAAKNLGIVVTSAENLLSQAKNAFNIGDYSRAEQLAIQVRTTVASIQLQASKADSSIKKATNAISTARSEGRLQGIASAQNLLQQAQAYYSIGDYIKAEGSANQANEAALNSRAEELNPLYIIGALTGMLVVGAVAYQLYRNRRPPIEKPVKPKKVESEGTVKLEEVFLKNPSLRVDDKEVLRFITDNGGEAFANEIRDRFDIPRTSAWRMIRRLINMGIVEERKIGGQSLIHITKKYREEPKS